MFELLAETLNEQAIVDYLVDRNEKLDKEMEKLMEELGHSLGSLRIVQKKGEEVAIWG